METVLVFFLFSSSNKLDFLPKSTPHKLDNYKDKFWQQELKLTIKNKFIGKNEFYLVFFVTKIKVYYHRSLTSEITRGFSDTFKDFSNKNSLQKI